MKETRFISQNKEKWSESETLLKEEVKDPEKLSNLFTQVIDDLSFSRTHYPNRSVRVYLNKIAREYFSIIYSHRREKKNRFKLFWLDELPQIIIFSKKPLLISLALFVFAMSVGVFSSINDPDFTSSILGETYVAMTKENIEKGDPMAVYKSAHQVDMFLGITFNNLMVAFRTYVFGVFLSIGTLAILLYNGIMVGCFQYFFIERGLFVESALTIWLHGTLEISSIILAGGAGLTLGSGLIFPGTYSRLQAFQMSAMRSLKLMLGVAPILVIAALIESFLTRYTDVPDFIKLLLILLSAAFIIGYFVVYPWLKSKSGFEQPIVETKLAADLQEEIRHDRIKNNGEIVKDAFQFYKTNSSKFLSWITGISVLMTIADLATSESRSALRVVEMWWITLFEDLFYAMKTPSLIFVLINTIGTSLILYRIVSLQQQRKEKFNIFSLIQITAFSAIIYLLIYVLPEVAVLMLLFAFIMFLLVMFVQHIEKVNLLKAIGETVKLSSANFGQVMGLQVILLLMCFSFLIILSAPLIYMNTSILEWNFAKTDTWARYIVSFIETFVKIFAFNLILPLLSISATSLYYTLKEIVTADHLKHAIEAIGAKTNRRKNF
jgi:uncharacterized membrane protein SpoIIM required for sporulation